MLYKKHFGSRKKLSNKGMSLVELVCAIAILGLSATVISSALSTSAMSYRNGIEETDMQKEAQIIVNQISDILIDATGEVTFEADGDEQKIIIEQEGHKHVITKKADNNVYYMDELSSDPEQLLARGIAAIDVDTDTFTVNGSVSVYVKALRADSDTSNYYEANYSITARNRTGGVAVADFDTEAVISVVDSLIMEPNQALILPASVTGVEDHTLEFSLVNPEGVDMDADTSVSSSGLIKIGRDQVESFKVKVATREMSGGAPKATRYVDVFIRRVNGFHINSSCTTGSATEKKAGAKYHLEVDLTGQYLDRDFASPFDDDYVNPYQIKWEVQKGVAEGYMAASFTENTAEVTLKEDLTGAKICRIKAYSLHAGAHPTIIENKTGLAYDTSKWDIWEKGPSALNIIGEGFNRNTDTEQAQPNGDFLNELKGSDDYGKGSAYWRFSYALQRDDESDRGPWMFMSEGGGGSDADDSLSINMRPQLSSLDPSHRYQIWLKVEMFDATTHKLIWPTSDTPASQYIVSGPMEKFGLTFTSDLLGLTDTVKGASNNYEDGCPVIEVKKDQAITLLKPCKVIGMESKDAGNAYIYTLYKKTSTGWDKIDMGGDCRSVNGPCEITWRPGYFSSYNNGSNGGGMEGTYYVQVGFKGQAKTGGSWTDEEMSKPLENTKFYFKVKLKN